MSIENGCHFVVTTAALEFWFVSNPASDSKGWRQFWVPCKQDNSLPELASLVLYINKVTAILMNSAQYALPLLRRGAVGVARGPGTWEREYDAPWWAEASLLFPSSPVRSIFSLPGTRPARRPNKASAEERDALLHAWAYLHPKWLPVEHSLSVQWFLCIHTVLHSPQLWTKYENDY